MIKSAKILLFVLVSVFSFSSCISDRKIIYLQGADTIYAVPRKIAQSFQLKIEVDDQLAISVSSKDGELILPFNNNTLIGGGATGTYGSNANISSGVSYFLVNRDGNIQFPIFGAVKVAGKTCMEVSDELQKMIRDKYIKDAVVNTKIMSFKVTVLGDVKAPGVQTFQNERLTLLEALGKAGDLNASARRDEVLVVREENGVRTTYSVDLRDPNLFNSPAYYLQQNDLIVVKPNKSVRVKGSTGYTLLSVGATVVSMIVSVVSLIIALKK